MAAGRWVDVASWAAWARLGFDGTGLADEPPGFILRDTETDGVNGLYPARISDRLENIREKTAAYRQVGTLSLRRLAGKSAWPS
jgi:hypothetical protein